jgi:hypothetical protein
MVPNQRRQEMTDRRTDPSLQDLDGRLLLGAGVALAVASLAGLAAFVMGSIAVITAGRPASRPAAPRDREPEVAAGEGGDGSRCGSVERCRAIPLLPAVARETLR